jgi:hypothetical protein
LREAPGGSSGRPPPGNPGDGLKPVVGRGDSSAPLSSAGTVVVTARG